MQAQSYSHHSLQNLTSGMSAVEWLEKFNIIARQSFFMEE